MKRIWAKWKQFTLLHSTIDRRKISLATMTKGIPECRVEDEEQNHSRTGSSVAETKKGETKGVLNATTLIKRRKKFNRNLTEITKKYHKAFLASLNPPLYIHTR